MSEYLEETLQAPERQRLKQHLAACPACAELLAAMRAQIEACQRTPRPEISRECVERAIGALRAELQRRGRHS